MKKSAVISLAMFGGVLSACSNPLPTPPQNQGSTTKQVVDNCKPTDKNCEEEKKSSRSSGGSLGTISWS